MSEPSGGSGWTFFKVVGVIIGLLGMAGFGLCSLCGLLVFGSDETALLLSALGAGLAFGFGWMVRAIFRKARGDRDGGA